MGDLKPIYGIIEGSGKFEIPQDLAIILFHLEYPRARRTEPTLMGGLCSSNGGVL